jgi:hypothetical protein
MGEPGEQDTAVWVSQTPIKVPTISVIHDPGKHKSPIPKVEGNGIVKLPNGESFSDDTFNEAVLHQLHCLVGTPLSPPLSAL